MLMRPNEAETAVHGCHCSGDMAACMRKVQARPWVGVRVCHLLAQPRSQGLFPGLGAGWEAS